MDLPPSYSELYGNTQPTPTPVPPPLYSVQPGPSSNPELVITEGVINLRQVVIVEPRPEIVTDRRLLEPPADYSCLAFLACTFCCLITGIVALAYTDEVQRHQQNGHRIQANKANRVVRNLIIATVVLGISLYITGTVLALTVL